jgi:hypothetical protein
MLFACGDEGAEFVELLQLASKNYVCFSKSPSSAAALVADM